MSQRLWGGSLGTVLFGHSIVAAALMLGSQSIPNTNETPPMLLELTPFIAPAPVLAPEQPPAPQAVQPAAAVPPKPVPRPKPKVERRASAPVSLPDPAPPAEEAPGDHAPVAAPPVTASAAPSLAVAPATTPANADPRAGANWQGRLLAHLERHRRYPDSAQGRGMRGTVVLDFAIDRTGRVMSAAVLTSSGHGPLDQAVLDMLARAQPLPPPPPEVTGDPVRLVVPVRFRLN